MVYLIADRLDARLDAALREAPGRGTFLNLEGNLEATASCFEDGGCLGCVLGRLADRSEPSAHEIPGDRITERLGPEDPGKDRGGESPEQLYRLVTAGGKRQSSSPLLCRDDLELSTVR